MSTSGNHFCVQWNNHQKNLLTVMSELLQNNALTDVTLGVDDGRSVECHKMILAACSSYFQTLFTQYPSKHPFVVLSGVKYPEIMRIVEFMYKGEVNVAQDELDAILKVAEALQVKGLIEANGWSPETNVASSPINNSNNNTSHPPETSKTTRHRRKSSSPAHSTSRSYHVNEESFADHENQAIPSPSTWSLSQGLPLGPQDFAAADAAYQSSLSTKCPSVLETHYEKTPETPAPRNRKRKMSRENVINRGTPILRTALKQGHTVGPLQQALPIYPEHHNTHYNNPKNGSTMSKNEERDDGQSSVDLSYRCPDHSPHANDNSIINGADKTSFSEESRTEIASYTSTQGQEAKRYKKYSRDDLTDAIQAVKEGMSANKAAALFKVPSRTLYDKIKKLGFTNQKHRRSGRSSSSACFPYGIGGNVDGSIYGHMMENDNDNSNLSTETPNNPLETSYDEIRETSTDRETIIKEIDQKSLSPLKRPRSQSPLPLKYQQQESALADDENRNDDDEVQDLSVNRKSDIPFSISQNIKIKEENIQDDDAL